MNECSDTTMALFCARIQDLVGSSEHLFLRFGATFPAFVGELHRSLDSSRSALESLGSGSTVEEAMGAIFSGTKAVLARSSEQFIAMRESDAELMVSLNRSIDTLGKLENVITKIKDDSIEMELISLNAMTVALKSGSAGKAFSVITDELKRLSSRTIALTEQLTEAGGMLLSLFTQYRTELENLEKTHASLFQGLDESIQARFTDLECSLRDVGNGLAELVKDSQSVETPVRTIMETVQVHDIIRQSLDHVLMAFMELGKLDGAPDPAGGADDGSAETLAFRMKLLELSETILKDVGIRLEDARRVFNAESSYVRSVIAKGEKKRRTLLDQAFGVHDSGNVSLSFDEASRVLDSVDERVRSYYGIKTSISAKGKRLTASVKDLELRFKGFDKILNRFRNIDVACRIEVSKQAVLRSINDTVSEMSSLIEDIGSDVDEAVSITEGFMADTETAMFKQNRVGLGQKERVDTGLKGTQDTLVDLKESIRRGAQYFTLFTDDFIRLLEDSSRDVSKMGELTDEVYRVVKDLASLRADLERRMGSLGIPADGADVQSERFREIIDRFTIYAHKRMAAQVGGFSIGTETGRPDEDQDTDAGSITFF